ncbi:MAG: YlxR family protein [Bacilli bacterium]|nr:YlxR family protein [Bacilli bacterium]MBO7535747.1 YlxR family protein [Bacilli bacterium]
MAQVKKVPIRRCLATNQPFPKKEMFRIVRTPDGAVIIDDTGKANGRGAYLSKTKEAIMIAKSKKLLDKQLEVAVSEEIYDELLKKLG